MPQDQAVKKMPQGGEVELRGGFGAGEVLTDLVAEERWANLLQRHAAFLAPGEKSIHCMAVGPQRVRALNRRTEELRVREGSRPAGRGDDGRRLDQLEMFK
jgi:hypothetical protein